jgi:hypothetical protein
MFCIFLGMTYFGEGGRYDFHLNMTYVDCRSVQGFSLTMMCEDVQSN